MAGIKVEILEKSTNIFTVTLTGPLDAETHQHFDYLLEKILILSTKAIVLDMGGVNYISSMGISSIFNMRKIAKVNNIELTMINLQPQVKKVFDTVQAMPSESIFDSVEELEEYLKTVQENAQEN